MKIIQVHIYNNDPKVQYELVVHKCFREDTKSDDEYLFEAVMRLALHETGFTHESLMATRRQDAVDIKRMVTAVMKDMTRITEQKLADLMGYKDHSSIVHNTATHRNLYKTDQRYKERYDELRRLSGAAI